MKIQIGNFTFLAGRKKISIFGEVGGVKNVPIEDLLKVLFSLEENKTTDRLERLRLLYKNALTHARGDQSLKENWPKYLALQGVAWEIIQEARQELPLMSDQAKKRVCNLLDLIEDANHRLDAILSTRLGVMGVGDIAQQARDFLDRKSDSITF